MKIHYSKICTTFFPFSSTLKQVSKLFSSFNLILTQTRQAKKTEQVKSNKLNKSACGINISNRNQTFL